MTPIHEDDDRLDRPFDDRVPALSRTSPLHAALMASHVMGGGDDLRFIPEARSARTLWPVAPDVVLEVLGFGGNGASDTALVMTEGPRVLVLGVHDEMIVGLLADLSTLASRLVPKVLFSGLDVELDLLGLTAAGQPTEPDPARPGDDDTDGTGNGPLDGNGR